MRWNIREKKFEYPKYQKKFEPWFAWYPVEGPNNKVVWLEKLLRYDSYKSSYYEDMVGGTRPYGYWQTYYREMSEGTEPTRYQRSY